METILATLNNVQVTQRVKFRDLDDGRYEIKTIEAKQCGIERQSWRSILVVALDDKGSFYEFFLPSIYSNLLSNEELGVLSNMKFGIRKKGVALTWFKMPHPLIVESSSSESSTLL